MEKLPVLADFHYDRIGSWSNGNPFCIAFCYTSKQYSRINEFIIKGGLNDVDREIKSRHFPMITFRTFWWRGHSRSIGPTFANFKNYTMTGETPYIAGIHQWKIRGGRYFYKHWELRYMRKIWHTFRRVPRKWLPEFDDIIRAQYPLP